MLREVREPQFEEQWCAGTYLVSGVFFFNGAGLVSSDITNAIRPLYERTKIKKRAIWPRGLSGYYIIPIFTAPSFDEDVVSYVHVRMPFQWAIWPEPVLYRNTDNSAERRNDYRLHGAAFHSYLNKIIASGLNVVAELAGHQNPCIVNGRSFNIT